MLSVLFLAIALTTDIHPPEKFQNGGRSMVRMSLVSALAVHFDDESLRIMTHQGVVEPTLAMSQFSG